MNAEKTPVSTAGAQILLLSFQTGKYVVGLFLKAHLQLSMLRFSSVTGGKFLFSLKISAYFFCKRSEINLIVLKNLVYVKQSPSYITN